jgi:hypothetical protein
MQYAGLIGQVTGANIPLNQRGATMNAVVLLASCRSRSGTVAMLVVLVKRGAPHGVLPKEASALSCGC